MSERRPIHDFLMAALKEMGIPSPSSLACSCLLQEGRLIAQKFRYDGGYAVWLLGSDVVEFFDRDGTLLKSAAIGTDERRAAA